MLHLLQRHLKGESTRDLKADVKHTYASDSSSNSHLLLRPQACRRAPERFNLGSISIKWRWLLCASLDISSYFFAVNSDMVTPSYGVGMSSEELMLWASKKKACLDMVGVSTSLDALNSVIILTGDSSAEVFTALHGR